MEMVDRGIVRRSNGFLSNKDFLMIAYGREFQYCEGTAMSNIVFALFFTYLMSLLPLILLFPPSRWILQKLIPPGSGPSETTRNSGYFHLGLVGECESGEKAFVEVKADGDPGYQATSMMVSEAALCLVLDRSKLGQSTAGFKTVRGGVLTPASAMGMVLVERLRKAGMAISLS